MTGTRAKQAGQAASEAVVVLALLATILASGAYIGSGLAYVSHTQQQGRDAAFRAARGQADVHASANEATGRRHDVAIERKPKGWLQPGGHGAVARTLRREWRLADSGVLRAAVAQSHTALLTDAGHTAGDAETQQRVGQSNAAWGLAYDRSSSLARAVGARMARADAGWQRSPASVDWLQRWSDIVPTDVKTKTPPAYVLGNSGSAR